MSLNVKLSAPQLSRPGASKPDVLQSTTTTSKDAGTNKLQADVPKAEEEAITSTIHFTDGVKEREAFYLKLLKSSLDDETLSDLRSNIAGLTGSIEISHFPFCGRKGAVVPDSFSIQEYLKECLGINTEETKTLNIYMKDTSNSQELTAVPDAAKVSLLKSQVDDTAFKWITGTQAKYVPQLEQRDWAVISDSNSLCYGIRVIRVKEDSDAIRKKPENGNSDPRGTPIGIERARFPGKLDYCK
ncbi:hypothetical protein NW768_009989 [Fusarium equiseti]|uniref:Uncharacterized protein n=1 Tax=Fusarium equiseti TaxID=61235 RepID=A0ABQ8R1N4_FUSEQ|nr:hypothetical protein NW768_009989 [Fusarium equiseti]